jgi:hypothetical protein
LRGFLFPLNLGWGGASYLALGGYLLVAGVLFTAADVMTQRGFYRHWHDVCAQSVLTLLTISLPAVLLFSIGQMFDRSEERMEDELCAMSGYPGGSDAPTRKSTTRSIRRRTALARPSGAKDPAKDC